MLEARLPADEKERFSSLSRLNILNTPMEDRYERITRMVCQMLNVPIASFTLVDDTRQWFKSVQGMTINETPRSVAFCAHTILSDELFVINDAKHDERFADSPLVTEDPNIGFYAGYPVHAPDGKRIGALCAIDNHPRQLSERDRKILTDLGKMIEEELKSANPSGMQSEFIAQFLNKERVSVLDEVSRLWNREGILEIMKLEWAEAEKNRSAMAIIQGSIDGFRALNDTHGQIAGDLLLQAAAKRMIGALGCNDALGRVGDDSFLIILPQCTPDHLKQTMATMLPTISGTPVRTVGKELNIRMSFGAAIGTPGQGQSLPRLLELSKKAMLQARVSGGDRYIVSES